MIEIENMSKRYGNLLALDSLSMKIEEGETLGLIGPNGAGKSTTIKILATLLKPSQGQARVADFCVSRQSSHVRNVLGYMPDFCGVYSDMRVREYLYFFAATYGMVGKKADSMVDDVLALTDLTGKADAMADSLSRGMQQRLQLARVLLHDPKVLLLDEPASGLDPRARIEIRMLLKELARMKKTIVISSHILMELAELCDSIAIMEQGRLVYHGDVKDAIAAAHSLGPQRILVSVTENLEEARDLISTQEGIIDVARGEDWLEVEHEGAWSPEQIFDLLTGGGFRLKRLEGEKLNLEDAFLHLTEGKVS